MTSLFKKIKAFLKKVLYANRAFQAVTRRVEMYFSLQDIYRIRQSEKLAETTRFVVIIPSYNNRAFCLQNLQSVFGQKYNNYRVIYIDDASSDGTAAFALECAELMGKAEKLTLVQNKENLGAMENIYRAAQSCSDHEVIVALDGDDWLSHDKVFCLLNEQYAQEGAWMTYGQFIRYPTYLRGDAAEIPRRVLESRSAHKGVRRYPWRTCALRTFYTSLFKQIKLQDLLEKGRFVRTSQDCAIMFPMWEMAGRRAKFISQVTYIYHCNHPNNDEWLRKGEQVRVENYFRQLPPYEKLKVLAPPKKCPKVDIVVFSYHRPLQLFACLESILTNLSCLGKISVVYRADEERYEAAYREVAAYFPKIDFLRQQTDIQADFKDKTLAAAFQTDSSAAYVAFSVDDIVIKEKVDVEKALNALEETSAYGFYLRLGKNITATYMTGTEHDLPYFIPVSDGILAWEFGAASSGDWNYPHTVDFTIYPKDKVEKQLYSTYFTNPNIMEGNWALRPPTDKVGLCFEESKAVNIPLNLVNLSPNRNMGWQTPEKLLEQFNIGVKMDIRPFNSLKHSTAHVEVAPIFIPR